jgi:hypothetical protein
MTIKIQSNGAFTGANSVSAILRAIVQTQAAQSLNAAVVTDLVDSSTGTAASTVALPANVQATAQSGSNLATKAALEAAFATVLNGMGEVLAKANTMGTAIGLPVIVDGSGAAVVDGTIAAITKTVAGATTGAQVAQTNEVINGLNDYLVTIAARVNELCAAVGVKTVKLSGAGREQSPVSAKGLGTGTAAATTAVSKASADALLVVYANAVATLAAKLTAANAMTSKPKVLAA